MSMELLEKPPHGSIEWLNLRHRDAHGRCVFGASEIPALMGASPYKNRADLFVSKRGEPRVSPMKPQFLRGHLIEPVLIEEAARRAQTSIVTPNVMYRSGRLVATLDGVDDPADPRLIVEAKTTTRYRIRDAEDLPHEWLWQAWAQQTVCANATVAFIVLDREQEINFVVAPTNVEAISVIEDSVLSFGELIDSGEEPDPILLSTMNYDHIAQVCQAAKTTIELPPDAVRWLEELDLARAMSNEAKQIEKFARDELARVMRGNEIGTINGEKAITWSLVNGRVSLDTEALKQDLPEVYERYSRRGEAYRTMRVAKKYKTTTNNEGEQQ